MFWLTLFVIWLTVACAAFWLLRRLSRFNEAYFKPPLMRQDDLDA